MFTMTMFLGGARTPALERALDASLRELGAVVVERRRASSWPERYEWARMRAQAQGQAAGRSVPSYAEAPTLGVGDGHGQGGERFLAIDVRGPRHPLWNMGLARRLSHRLRVWAGAMVNDRLHDNYGFGFFYAGHVVQAAARTWSGILFASGGSTRTWFRGPGVEYENSRSFLEHAEELTGIRSGGPPPEGGRGFEVFAVEALDGSSAHDIDERISPDGPEARAWFDVVPAPLTQAVVADANAAYVHELRALASRGWEVAIHALPASYDILPDGSLDEEGVHVAVLRAADGSTPVDVLRSLDATPSAATVVAHGDPQAPIQAWHRRAGDAWTRAVPRDMRELVAAFQPVTQTTARVRPIQWDLPAPGEPATTG